MFLAGMIALIVLHVLKWGLLNATFVAKDADGCRMKASGACWAFIGEKYRLILFGMYPYPEQWRPLVATLTLISVIVCSANRSFWNARLLSLWIVGLAFSGVLMWGGLPGLPYVEDERWGGLPVTLIFSTFGIGAAFPLGVLLALGRRSRLPVIRTLSVAYIELIRGVPLISVLFLSSVMLPLFLPDGLVIDKLLRAQVAIVLFAAAYVAEVIRGGLQGVPKGQYEGAASLGLGYWQMMFKVVLPQALKITIPSLVSTFLSLLKDTSLVVVIGIFDLTLTARAALADPEWGGFDIEAYVFIAAIYFLFCYLISRYSRRLERRLAKGHL